MLRSFRRPRWWTGAWIAMILGVIALSLMQGPPIPDWLVIAKFDHGFAYFCLATMAVQLYAGRFEWIASALLLGTLGIALEYAQGFLTDYRDMSAYDGAIDCVGVVIGLATARMPGVAWLQKLDARLR
ncbi:MAG TPA: VanZ family protein [Xanthomonadaceae bacterium]|jgi:hypothetical protein